MSRQTFGQERWSTCVSAHTTRSTSGGKEDDGITKEPDVVLEGRLLLCGKLGLRGVKNQSTNSSWSSNAPTSRRRGYFLYCLRSMGNLLVLRGLAIVGGREWVGLCYPPSRSPPFISLTRANFDHSGTGADGNESKQIRSKSKNVRNHVIMFTRRAVDTAAH